MAKSNAKIGDFVKYSPDRGNENPNGRTILHGKVSAVNEDGTCSLTLNNGKVKLFVSEGNSLGTFKIIPSPKTKRDIPSDVDCPYQPETIIED